MGIDLSDTSQRSDFHTIYSKKRCQIKGQDSRYHQEAALLQEHREQPFVSMISQYLQSTCSSVHSFFFMCYRGRCKEMTRR